jgi:hypothetical protein
MPKANPENRCLQISAHGRQCRSLRAPDHPSLCSYHAEEQERKRQDSAALALDLLGPVPGFYTAFSINNVIGNLLVLLASDRIPPRKGAVLAYTCQLLLQSQREVKSELREIPPELLETLMQVVKPSRVTQSSSEGTKDRDSKLETDGSMRSDVSPAVPSSPSSAAAASPSPGPTAFCDSIPSFSSSAGEDLCRNTSHEKS